MFSAFKISHLLVCKIHDENTKSYFGGNAYLSICLPKFLLQLHLMSSSMLVSCCIIFKVQTQVIMLIMGLFITKYYLCRMKGSAFPQTTNELKLAFALHSLVTCPTKKCWIQGESFHYFEETDLAATWWLQISEEVYSFHNGWHMRTVLWILGADSTKSNYGIHASSFCHASGNLYMSRTLSHLQTKDSLLLFADDICFWNVVRRISMNSCYTLFTYLFDSERLCWLPTAIRRNEFQEVNALGADWGTSHVANMSLNGN